MSMIPDICGMHILLVAATSFEIQPAIDLLSIKAVSQPPYGPSVSKPSDGPIAPAPVPTHPGHSITTLITGVGSVATTWSLMRQIDRQRPDLIIQAGIAGSFTRKPPGEVVVVEAEELADLGVWEGGQFRSLFDLKLTDGNRPPFSGGQLVNPYRQLLALTALEQVKGITVNEISTDPGRIRWYQQNTAAVVESMEGGGLHYTALQEKIAFLQLRSVSNDIGVRDKTKWDIRSAISRLNEELIALLGRLETAAKTVLEP
jgi:futalosine hydrolase